MERGREEMVLIEELLGSTNKHGMIDSAHVVGDLLDLVWIRYRHDCIEGTMRSLITIRGNIR